jgi:diguanylate cyclase (GGDEF)-like protein/PAS domain S-box-containing protein
VNKEKINQQLLDVAPEAMIILNENGVILQVNALAEILFGYQNGTLIGICVEKLIPQDLAKRHRKLRRKFHHQPTSRHMGEGKQFLSKRKDGTTFFADISLRPYDADNDSLIIASIRDISHQIETQSILAQKVTQLEALHEIVVAISSTQDIGFLLNLIVEQAVELVGASSCSILMPDEQSDGLVFRAAVDDIVGIVVPPGQGIATRVLENGAPEIVNNAITDPSYYSLVQETRLEIQNIMVVPLLVEGKAIGVLSAINKNVGIFTQADCDLFTTLANHAAISIQKTRLYDRVQRDAEALEAEVARRTKALRASQSELKQRNLELNRLYRASDTLFFSRAPIFEDLANTIVETVLAEFGQTNCSLFVIRPESRILDRVAIRGSYVGELSKGQLSFDGPGLVSLSIRTKKIVNISDVRESPDYVGNWKSACSELAVPLIMGDQVIGVIDVQSRKLNAFGTDDVRLMSIFAERASMALENVRLFEAERQRRIEAEMLRQASSVVAATLQQNEAIDEILSQLAHVVPYDSASVQLLGDGYLEIVGGRGWADLDEIAGLRFDVPNDNPNTEVVERGQAVILDDTRGKYPEFLKTPHSHIRSWLGVPLIMRERVIGMLALDSKSPNFYTQEHTRLVTAFADHVAIAISNAQLFEQTQSTLAETEMLYRIARVLIHTDNLNDLLQSLVDNVAENLPADRVMLTTLNLSEHKINQYVVGGPGKNQIMHAKFDELWDGLSGWVLRELKPAFSPKNTVDPRESDYVQKRRHETNCGAILAVPLFHRDEAIGTITVINRLDQENFSQRHVELMETIASQAAIAIENARLFGENQWLATTDELTGINNRRHLFKLGHLEIERARRYGHSLSAIMLDIDNFKRINDTHGHGIGDKVLRSIAQGCLQSIREFDVLGRYGGEEFVVILPETELKEAIATAERLRICIAEQSSNSHSDDISLTISLGVAVLDDSMEALASLLDAADSALLLAKKSGRNRVEVADNRQS